MAYIGLLLILMIAYFVEWLDTRSEEKQTDELEEIHKDIYSLIDEHYIGYENRERKAQTDAMIGAFVKDNGKKYRPHNIKMVTTAEERKKRIKAELDGTSDGAGLIKAQLLDSLNGGFECEPDEGYWYYEDHTEEEKREHLIKYLVNAGDSMSEAEKYADNFFKLAKEL